MEWIQSTMSKEAFSSSRTSPYKLSDNERRKSAANDVALLHLKQSYNERVQSLESQIKQIYKEVQSDALLETMGRNEASSVFRNQRIQEIVEDGLLSEKEAQIEMLIQENSYLKSELIHLKEDSQNLAQASLEEITGLQATASELNQSLAEQIRISQILEQENEKLKESIKRLQSDYEQVLTQTEGEAGDLKRTYLTSLANLEHDYETTRKRKETLEVENKEREIMLSELKMAKENLRKELALKEESFSTMKLENYRLETALRELHHNSKRNQTYEDEIDTLKSQLRAAKATLRDNREGVKTPTKGHEDFSKTSRLLVLETQQKVHNEKIEEVKKKYKKKCEKYKGKSKELAAQNETLNGQVNTLKQSLENEREQVVKVKSQKEEELRVLRSRFEEKLSRQDIDHQTTLAELKAKNQLQISQLESEKSKLESKAADALNYSSNYSSKARSYEMESKAKMESSLAQMENNYILKSKHENILTVEVMNLQTKHAKEIQKMNEEFEKELKRKARDIQENYEDMHTNTIKNIRESKMHIEEELENKKKEIVKLIEKQDDQKKVVKNLREELDESKKRINELHANLVEANHKLTDLKNLNDAETKKIVKLEGENKDIIREKNEISKRRSEVETVNVQLKEQIKRLEENKCLFEDSVKKSEIKNDSLNAENRDLIRKLEEANHEKHSLRRELDDVTKSLERDIQKLNDRIDEEKREVEDRNKVIQNERYLKEQLEDTMQDLQHIEQNLKAELTATQEAYRQLHNKHLNQRTEFKNNLFKVWKIVSGQIEAFRRQLESLRSNACLQIEKNQNAVKLDIQNLMRSFVGSFNMLKTQKADDESAILEQHECEVIKYEKALKKYAEENCELNHEVEKLNKHVSGTLDTLEETKVLISDYTVQIESLKHKNAELNKINAEMYKANADLNKVNIELKRDLKETQDLVDTEIKRLNDDLQTSVPDMVNKLKGEHKAEIKKIMEELDEVRRRECRKMKTFENSVFDLQRDFESQLEEVKKAGKVKVAEYEEKIEILKAKMEEQTRENLGLSENLKKTKETCYDLDRENKRMIGKYEDKIQDIKGIIRKETMQSELEKQMTYQENGKLKQSLNDLKQKLQVCDLEISTLNQVRNDQQECIIKYKTMFDKKRRTNDDPQVDPRGY